MRKPIHNQHGDVSEKETLVVVSHWYLEVVCYFSVPWLRLAGAHIYDNEAPQDHKEKQISQAEIEKIASPGTQQGREVVKNLIENVAKANIL